jgi:hypothetical protein
MKNLMSIKSMLFALSTVALLASCKKENVDETITVIPPTPAAAKIEGNWEVYKIEKQELVSDLIGGQIVWSMGWVDQTPLSAEESTMTFDGDKTFQQFYAEVPVGNGNWEAAADNPYQFTVTFNAGGWSPLQDIYTLQLACDNTMSVKYRVEPPAGNHNFQNEEWYVTCYFKTPGTVPCDSLVDYNVN